MFRVTAFLAAVGLIANHVSAISQCAFMLCAPNTQCRDVYDTATGDVEGQCVENVPDGSATCTVGQPLLVSTGFRSLAEAFCGRSPNRIACPAGFYCHVAPNDAYAVCCANEHNRKKRAVRVGNCPEPVMVSGCVPTCTSDDDCPGAEKCCSSNCGGSKCSTPNPNCQTLQCPAGLTCEMYWPESCMFRKPCWEEPRCV